MSHDLDSRAACSDGRRNLSADYVLESPHVPHTVAAYALLLAARLTDLRPEWPYLLLPRPLAGGIALPDRKGWGT